MMKKILLASFALFLFCGAAKAQNIPVQVIGGNAGTKAVQGVLGVELSGVALGMTDNFDMIVEDVYSALTLSGGVKIKDRFSITGFYQFSGEEDKTVGYLNTTGSFTAAGIDGTFYIPVNPKFDITASVGVGHYDFEVSSNSYLLGGNEKHYGVRFGGGVEFKLSDNLALTGNLRYVAFDYDEDVDVIEDLAEVGIGLKLYF